MAYPPDGTVITTITRTNFELLVGTYPDCAPPPPECTLEITGVTKTDETTSGAGDGTITIAVSGNTGTTVTYTITKDSTILQATGTTSYEFTGLTAGQWTVRVDEGACYDTWSSAINILQGYFTTAPFNVNTNFLPVIAASENPIVFEIQTAGTGLQPLQGIYQFTVVSGATINDGFHIDFVLETPEYSTSIIAKGFPNRGNYMLCSVLTTSVGVPLTYNSANDIAVSLAEALQNDLVLSKYYYIGVEDNVVTLKTKEYTGKYNLINNDNLFIYNENNVVSTTGITFSTVTQGQDAYQGSLQDGYSVYAELYVSPTEEFGGEPDLSEFIPVAELTIPYLADNSMRFDVAEVLKNYVWTPKIDFTFTGYTTLLPCIKPYYIVYGEKFFLVKNSSTKKKRQKGTTRDTVRYIINASLPWESQNTMESYLGNYDLTGGTGQTVTGVTFLTTAPNPKFIQRQSTEYLYFILPKDYGKPLDFRGKITFYDGTEIDDYKFFDITTNEFNFGGVVALACGADKLGLDAIETSGGTLRKIKQIDFAIYQDSGATAFSETRSFRFAIDESERKFGIMMLNSKGGFDAWTFNGIVENGIERTYGTYTVPREYGIDGASPKGFNVETTYSVKTQRVVTCNTGWINVEHFDYLMELMKSPMIFSYTETNQNYLNLINYTYKKSSLEDLYDCEVTFRFTTFENAISDNNG